MISMRDILPRLLAAGAAACSYAWGAGRLDLQSGGTQPAGEDVRFREGQFILPDGTTLDRSEVRDWWVREAPEAAPETPATDAGGRDAITAQLARWREQGQAMADRHPGCRGVYIVDHGSFVFTHDGTNAYRYHFVGLVTSEERMDWGKLQFSFTQGRSRCRVTAARALAADGTLTELHPEDLTESSPGRGDVHFDPNARVLTGTIPGVAVGSVVEYEYMYENYAPEDWRLLFPGYVFQMDMPCVTSRMQVLVPDKVTLQYWADNWPEEADPEPVRGKATFDGTEYDSYAWELRHVPPLVREPLMPDPSEVVPSVHAGVLEDWDYLNDFNGAMQLERMNATPEIRAVIERVTADAETPEDKLAALYHWVQKNIRYISIKSSLSSGWTGHPAAETLRLGYGDCTDKSILLSTMLREVGIEAEPVVLRTNDEGDFDPRAPVLNCNHCITEVRLDGNRMYLDPTAQDYRYPFFRGDNHGVMAFNFISRERRRVPVPKGMDGSGKKTREQVAVNADGSIEVSTRNTYQGMYEAGLRGHWKRVPEQVRSQVMQQYLNGIAPGAESRGFEISDPQDLGTPFHMAFAYRAADYVKASKELRIFQLPARERSFREAALESRQYPVVYTTTEAWDRHVSVALPQEWKAVELPEPINFETPHLHYREQFKKTDNGLQIHLAFERRVRRIPTEAYAAYRDALRKIETWSRRPLYFAAPQRPAAP